jgi:transcriptional regulator with XRE-family HTH domain
MPDDDPTQRDLAFRLGASPRTVRAIAGRLGIEPRRAGGAVYYTREQVEAIEREHKTPSISKTLRKATVK